MKYTLRIVLIAASVTAYCNAADADADGMEDAWETSMGLSATNPDDALADKDGDRVPNLWEFMRGTAANNSTSVPAFDAIVIMNPAAGATPPQFATLQAAYDSLPATSDFFIVKVLRGYYPATLNMGAVPKRVTWIGETGPDRLSGFESVVLKNGSLAGTPFTYSGSGLEFGATTVFDGFILDGAGIYAPCETTAIRVYDVDGSVPRVRLANVIVRDWSLVSPDGSYRAGAVLNLGADLWLVHCTLWKSSGLDGVTYAYATIDNQAGSLGKLHLMNSIVNNGDSGSSNQEIIGDIVRIWGVTSYLQAPSVTTYGTATQLTGTMTYFPYLCSNGYVNESSLSSVRSDGSLLGEANSLGSAKDINGEGRPTALSSTVKMSVGADQWLSTDSDSLANWWEMFWFGNLAQTWTNDPDGDGINNANEQYGGTAPIADQDVDGLIDVWEKTYFGFVGAQSASDNPDNDGRTNLQEYQAGTNPTLIDPDFDGDSDGLFDVWEILYFGNVTSQDGLGDPDEDGANNWEEYLRGSSPLVFSEDWDQDGWIDLWEKQTFATLFESLLTDFDGDGLTNGFELVFGSNMLAADSNGDGINDGLALIWGLPVINVSTDSDNDGLTNDWEVTHGTNPFLADSDNDGVTDALDALPLDPLASAAASLPGPPLITLTSPPSAVLVP